MFHKKGADFADCSLGDIRGFVNKGDVTNYKLLRFNDFEFENLNIRETPAIFSNSWRATLQNTYRPWWGKRSELRNVDEMMKQHTLSKLLVIHI